MTANSLAALPPDLVANPRLSQWVTVGGDGCLDVRVGKVELGQGILTALAQVAADALGVEVRQVRMLAAHTAKGPDEGLTSGSMSVFHSAPALRMVCAVVRQLFTREAARRWGVEPVEVLVSSGCFRHPERPEGLSYADLRHAVDLHRDVDADLLVDVPAQPPRLVGTPVPRIDLPAKVSGRPAYIHDLRLPGQRFGRVLRPPSPGASLQRLDPVVVDALRDEGVLVVVDGSFVGVVADDERLASTALERLRAASSWHGGAELPDEADLTSFLRAGPLDTSRVAEVGDMAPGAGRLVTASYSRPFIAHASIAPSCGVARWEDDGSVSVWSHSQGVHNLRDAIARTLALDPQQVVVEHCESAGCYGHNGADDAAFDAVLLARAVPGHPVHVQWSRQDELSWAPFGSAMCADVEARVGDDGELLSWTYDVWSQGHTSRPGFAGHPGLLAASHVTNPLPAAAPADPPAAAGGGTSRNADPGYDVPYRRVTAHRLTRTPVRSSALRALGAHFNVFAIESFVDEVALATGRDPLELRLAHLSDPRARRVLTTAAERAGWGSRLRAGSGRGLAVARYKGRGAYCAVVAEVEAEQDVRVRRLTVAVDVGAVINPDGVRNQIEGGATQATSWTLKERVRFDRHRITSVDWESYPILRFSEAPEIDVQLVDAADEPSVGAGEAAAGPTSGAIANAVADALGVRVRDLPITAAAVVAAIESDD
ncbi:MAG TPA: molybdopterin cofactor-binding domain-containing protein [Angustibacter sp.]|nr:molybdopterin cofactor-binding domain-containing protein [Angustibacter sp.]